MFQQRMVSYTMLRQSSRIEKKFANILEEYDTWSKVFD